MDASQLAQEVSRLHAEICSALADPSRILILYSLGERPHTVTELAASLSLSQPATSRHLKVLRDRGLVAAARQGQSIEYSLTDARIIQALDLLRSILRDSLAHRAQIVAE